MLGQIIFVHGCKNRPASPLGQNLKRICYISHGFFFMPGNCEKDKSATMRPMVGGKLSKSKESYLKCVLSARTRHPVCLRNKLI